MGQELCVPRLCLSSLFPDEADNLVSEGEKFGNILTWPWKIGKKFSGWDKLLSVTLCERTEKLYQHEAGCVRASSFSLLITWTSAY